MKKIFSAMICAVVMLASACTKDLTEGQNGGNVEMKTVTYSVSFEAPEAVDENGTRIALGTDNNLVWEVGDAITIVYTPTGGSITGVTSEALAAGDVAVGQPIQEAATFSVTMPTNATIHYAYSSRRAADELSANQLRPHMSASYTTDATTANNWGAHTDLGEVLRDSYATGAVNTSNNTITLRNSSAFLEVQLEGTDVVWSVDVFSKSMNLRGRYGYVASPASDNPTMTAYQTVQATSEGPSSLGGAHFYATDANGGGRDLNSGKTSFFFAMPIYDLPAGDLFLQIRTGSYTRLIRSKAAHSFKRNHVTRLKAITVQNIDADGVDYQPLDVEGTSNCYMVAPSNEDKYYSFSVKNVDGTQQIGAKSYGVWPMWATADGLVEDIAVDYTNHRVFFKVPGGKGKGSCVLTGGTINSALIGTNWAWHIWITDAHAVTYGNPAITVLDRAPGALWVPTSKEEVVAMTGETAAQTVGFMYQYGRAVPFPGPKNLGNPNLSNKWGYEGPGNTGDKSRFGVNTQHVEYYHFARWQNAFTIYGNTNKTALDTRYYNMSMLQMNGTWATDVTQESIQSDGLTGNKALWSTAQKGNQDPCPQGYRVAGITELEKILRRMKDVDDGTLDLYGNHYSPANKTFSKTSTDKPRAADVYGTFSDGEYGQGAKADRIAALNGNFIWFPHGGFRMCKQNTPDAAESGTLLYATSYYHENDAVLRPGIGVIWGVADYDLKNLIKVQEKTPMPSHAISTYPNLVRIPYKWAAPGENVWLKGTLETNDVSMKNDDGVGKWTLNKGGLPAHDAAPVRCVKLATASGGAQVASLAGQATDANAWK